MYNDLGYGDIITDPLVAPAPEQRRAQQIQRQRRTFSFARSSGPKRDPRVSKGYPRGYHW
ncbi:hypothetical protein VSDG_08174 [Cytospora chrysosperma]|uniref:Uncharacterized protein n=1 Tax=Cytospora chrysosperma TaxID=252740 RepID=A0A423VH13_CYTCH|nr:hypothetical protein VSDG_08174 [Valsa sordida]